MSWTFCINQSFCLVESVRKLFFFSCDKMWILSERHDVHVNHSVADFLFIFFEHRWQWLQRIYIFGEVGSMICIHSVNLFGNSHEWLLRNEDNFMQIPSAKCEENQTSLHYFESWVWACRCSRWQHKSHLVEFWSQGQYWITNCCRVTDWSTVNMIQM